MLSLAEGMTPKAGSSVTITHRDHPDQPVTVNLTGDVATSSAANVEVLPGDIVAVAKAGIVYVVGDVKSPAGVIIGNGSDMTVWQFAHILVGEKTRTPKRNKKRA